MKKLTDYANGVSQRWKFVPKKFRTLSFSDDAQIDLAIMESCAELAFMARPGCGIDDFPSRGLDDCIAALQGGVEATAFESVLKLGQLFRFRVQ